MKLREVREEKIEEISKEGKIKCSMCNGTGEGKVESSYLMMRVLPSPFISPPCLLCKGRGEICWIDELFENTVVANNLNSMSDWINEFC